MQRALLALDALDERAHLSGHEVIDPHRDAATAGLVDQRGRLLDRLGPVHLRAPALAERPVQYTVAPAAPSCTAMPRPAPRVAPATSATLPLRDCAM